MGTWGICKDYLDIRDAKARHLRELKNKRWCLRRKIMFELVHAPESIKQLSELSWKIIEIIGQDLDSYYIEYIYPADYDLHEHLDRW